MLSERQLEAILKIFQERMQAVNEHYLTLMGEHLKRIGTLSPSDVNRLIELKRLNYNMEQIKREIAKAANVSVKDVEKAFKAVAESDLRFANKVFAADHTPAIKASATIERILKAQARITKQALANLSQTTILSEGYKNAIDVAIQSAQGGVTDYNSAIRRAMKTAAVDGLRVQYPNSGISRRLDSAVRMNVLDGIRAINQDVMRQVGKEFGADGVEISAHKLCAEDHLPYQGKQISNKEFDRLQNTILDRPFGMWNCRHTWHPILLGISEPAYSPEELAEFKQYSREEITIDGRTKSRYEWTQEQRRIETAIRQQKDIAVAAKASGDMLTRRECAYMIRELDKMYGKITDGAGLLAKPERMRVAGYNAVKPANELKKDASMNSKVARAARVEANGLFVNDSEILFRNAKHVQPIKGFEDFTCHADAHNFFIDMKGKGNEEDYFQLSPAQYAEAIKNSPTYKGGNVRILSCQAGAEENGAAQQLADALGVNVCAPTEIVNIAENGEIFLSDNDILADLWYNASDRTTVKQTGKWVVFYPRKE